MDLYINMGATWVALHKILSDSLRAIPPKGCHLLPKLFRKKNHFLSFLKTESSNHIFNYSQICTGPFQVTLFNFLHNF